MSADQSPADLASAAAPADGLAKPRRYLAIAAISFGLPTANPIRQPAIE